MSITIFKGLPGSGKSKRLIERVNEAMRQHRPVLTLLCSDFPWLMGYGAYVTNRSLQCRQPGVKCPLSHFVSTAECIKILRRTSPGTLVAIEEAQSFGSDVAPACVEASHRGVDLILVSPSNDQVRQMPAGEYREIAFPINCQRCHRADATTVIVLPGTEATHSVCHPCFEEMTTVARQEIAGRLVKELPHPGKRAIYQPVSIPECTGWPISREDSKTRAEIMMGVIRDVGLLSDLKALNPTYLDIGCNTGYFCDHLQKAGFYAKGIDSVENNVRIAQLLDSFVRRAQRPNKKFVTYEAKDAYDYLRDTQNELFDVVSAFSVIQWIMIQRSVEDGVACLKRFYAKARRLCVLEMGYTQEENYRKQLQIRIDRDWVLESMKKEGNFEEIRVFDIHVIEGGRKGVHRDLFIGIKPTADNFSLRGRSGPICRIETESVTVDLAAQTKAVPEGTESTRITAQPNPVPAGSGEGSTRVSWDVGDASGGSVYVAVNGGEEKLFSSRAKGFREAPWIRRGGVYEFRLYRGEDRAVPIGVVKVTKL